MTEDVGVMYRLAVGIGLTSVLVSTVAVLTIVGVTSFNNYTTTIDLNVKASSRKIIEELRNLKEINGALAYKFCVENMDMIESIYIETTTIPRLGQTPESLAETFNYVTWAPNADLVTKVYIHPEGGGNYYYGGKRIAMDINLDILLEYAAVNFTIEIDRLNNGALRISLKEV